jgi:hypothetical protein
MATRRVASRAGQIGAFLDSPEIAPLIGELDELSHNGRPGYGARALLGACLVRSIYCMGTWTRTAELIAEHAGLADVLGGTPSVWACYRFAAKLRENRPALAACIDALAASLRAQHPDMGEDVAIDASDMPAYANGQRFLYNNGPERQRFSDPDASWGHRSAVSTRKGGGFYGYKLHMASCTRTGLPLAWEVQTARRHESLYVAPLLDATRARGFRPATLAADKAYDNNRIYAECEERDCAAIIPLRGVKAEQPVLPVIEPGRHNPRIPRHTDEWRALYRRRSAVEREFGRLKHEFGLAPLRTQGLARVRIHADLCVLARLAQALSRAREMQLAA